MKIYIYGIIDSNKDIEDSIKGLEESLIYNIPYSDIGVAASNLYDRTKNFEVVVNQDHILEHEMVVEKLIENFTVLPVRFGTTFNKKEEVLSTVKDYYRDFKKNFDRLSNKVEFGIKAIWPGEKIRERLINAHQNNNNVPTPESSPLNNFIKEKYLQYKIQKEFEDKADNCIRMIDNFFTQFAHEKKLERLKTENLFLNAYYLVEKESQVDFKKAFERLRSTLRGFKYLLSGPWPPYNFINLTKKSDLQKNIVGNNIFNKLLEG